MGDMALWAESNEEPENGPSDDVTGHSGDVDESMAARRLRRWLRGMFGTPKPADLPNDDE